jgi:ATP-dependent DNA helicase RecQ
MALRRPQDDAHFALIPGVGQRKLEAYGTLFTDAIREYCLLHNMEMDLEPLEETQPETSTTRAHTHTNASRGMTHQITLSMYKAGKSIEEIAQERSLKPSTVMSHLAELVEDGETIDITPLIPAGHHDVIVAALYQVGFTTLKPVKELLGDEYSYDEIRLVRAYLRNGKEK